MEMAKIWKRKIDYRKTSQYRNLPNYLADETTLEKLSGTPASAYH